MLSQYSNYDSDELVFGTKNGGLNGYQEFRPQPQQIVSGAGLLVSSYCDVLGTITIDYTNIIQEPYAFSEQYSDILPNTIKTIVSPIKAQYFRVRFRNTESTPQTILKLNTYILPTNPLFKLDTASSFKLDNLGNIVTTLQSTAGNYIKIDASGNLNTHNVNTSNSSALTFSVSGGIITSNIINLGEYKNFDIILNNITANNTSPAILDIYVSPDNITYVKSSYNTTINQNDLATGALNCVSNCPYIKLSGTSVTGLTVTSGIVYMKG